MFLFLSTLGFVIFMNPTIKYWSIVTNNDRFENGIEFTGLTFFQMLFSASAIYIFYKVWEWKFQFSLIPIFLIYQAGTFTALIGTILLSYWIIQIVAWAKECVESKFQRVLYKRVQIYNYLHSNTFFTRFFIINKQYELLAGDYIKNLLIVAYIISGIVTVSYFANTQIIDMMKSMDYKESDMAIIFEREIQIYFDIFGLTVFPILLSALMNNKADQRAKKEKD